MADLSQNRRGTNYGEADRTMFVMRAFTSACFKTMPPTPAVLLGTELTSGLHKKVSIQLCSTANSWDNHRATMELSVNAATSSNFSSVSFSPNSANKVLLLLGMVHFLYVSAYRPRIIMTWQTPAVLSDLTVLIWADSWQWLLPSPLECRMVFFSTSPPSWAV